MPTQDTSEVKEKIVSYLKSQGPLLPVQIAREIGISSLFVSAYLSELISAKRLKVSNMKIGNSPLYYLPEQENLLEKFSNYLKSKEKEAFEEIREKKVLKDSELEPATRVALQGIEDFAVPFEYDGEKYWKYMTISESEAVEKFKESGQEPESPFEENPEEKAPEERISKEKNENEGQSPNEPAEVAEEGQKPETGAENEIRQETEGNSSENSSEKEAKFESPLKDSENPPEEIGEDKKQQTEEKSKKKSTAKKSTSKKSAKKSSSDKTNKFFNKVKEFLSGQEIEISDIIGFSKDDLVLKVQEKGQEKLLIAYNKNKLDEDDLIKAYKKASDFDMKYIVLSKNGALKKLENLLEALGKLDSVKGMK